MKSRFKLFGIIAAVAIVGLSMTGCDNDNGSVIPSEWRGTFRGGPDTWTLHADGGVSWNIGGETGSMSGATVVAGGTVTMPGVNGRWVYLMQGGERWGIMVQPTPHGVSVGLARGAVQNILGEAQAMGATFNPMPNLSNIIARLPGDGYTHWGGDTNP